MNTRNNKFYLFPHLFFLNKHDPFSYSSPFHITSTNRKIQTSPKYKYIISIPNLLNERVRNLARVTGKIKLSPNLHTFPVRIAFHEEKKRKFHTLKSRVHARLSGIPNGAQVERPTHHQLGCGFRAKESRVGARRLHNAGRVSTVGQTERNISSIGEQNLSIETATRRRSGDV